MRLGDHVVLVGRAAGATRLIASADGALLFAEIAGAWQEESFRNDDLPPPVLRLVDVASDSVAATVQGWALTAPDAGLYLAPGDEELTYRVRRVGGAPLDVALEPPDGVWAVKATLPAPAAGRGVVILWRPIAGTWGEVATRREEVWLASIDAATGAVVASRTLALAGRTVQRGRLTTGAGVAVNAGDGTIYLASRAAAPGAIELAAIDPITLATRWSHTFAAPAGGLADATGDVAAVIGSDGDGAAIAIVIGDNQPRGVRPDGGHLLDRDGAVQRELTAAALQPFWDVAALGPAGAGQLFGHSALDAGHGTRRTFGGVFALRTADGAIAMRFDPAGTPGTQGLRSLASTWDGRRLLIAPASFNDARRLGADVGHPPTDGTGLEREEIRGAIVIPTTWYADGRPRYDAWRAQFR